MGDGGGSSLTPIFTGFEDRPGPSDDVWDVVIIAR